MKNNHRPKLGVNIDHVATLRQARGGVAPSPLEAANEAERGGADSITIHLREDRRHIQDHDVEQLKKSCSVPLNLEMALASDIIRMALKIRPQKVCIVPEKRQELTTEGGLNVLSQEKTLRIVIRKLKKKKIEVSLFIDPDKKQIKAAKRVGAGAIEIHTGSYANAKRGAREKELQKIRQASRYGHLLGLKVHAGHGLDYKNVVSVASIPEIRELNIGHSIIGQAVFSGLRQAVYDMKKKIKSLR